MKQLLRRKRRIKTRNRCADVGRWEENVSEDLNGDAGGSVINHW